VRGNILLKARHFFKEYRFVVSILLVSGLLRWVLIFRGGQFYFPDESRYGIAQDALVLLLEGKVRTALLTLVGELAHVGFKLTALIPALFENLFHTSLVLPAIFFSFFSILNLLLIWMIALRAGASRRVANYALFLAAASHVLLYYSRHIFPYDQAMFFGLLALYVALGNMSKPASLFLCGGISFLCLVTYNGYWQMAAFPMIVGMFLGEKEKDWLVKRPAFLGSGFLTPLAVLLLACFVIGKDIFSDYGVYLRKIVQGSFSEGWSLPFEYFWHAEHGFILIVGAFTLIALFLLPKNGNKFLHVSLGGVFFIYLSLAILSNLTHTFVVYARTARQLMPFLVLTAAYGLAYFHSWKPRGRWLVHIAMIVFFVQAAWNYGVAYRMEFPGEFIRNIQAQEPEFQIAAKMVRFYAPLVCKKDDLVAKNYHYIYTWPQSVPPVQGDVLLNAPHPINFLHYQYDGYTPAERQAIRAEYFEMVLFEIDANDLESFKNEIENCNQEGKGG
jgi:hypothetical protein